MRYTGIVKRFFAKTGYGFIEQMAETGGQDVIVHHKEVIPRYADEYIMLYEGQRVEFELVRTDRGFRAEAVRRVN